MSQSSQGVVSAHGHGSEVQASKVPGATVRDLLLALAASEDELRQLEARAPDERGADWAASRAALAERERVIVQSLRHHGLQFTAHPHDGAAADHPDGCTGQGHPGRGPAGARPAPQTDPSSWPEDLAAAQLMLHQLQGGLNSRTAIGQAEGILMERHHLSAEDAFTRLRICSQLLNLKLRDVASDLAETGEEPLPDAVLDERAAPEPPTPHTSGP